MSVIFAVGMLVSAGSQPTHAQQTGPAASAGRSDDEARARFEAGRALVDLELYRQGHAEFLRGFEISARAEFLFNMAECSRRAGDFDEARREYAEYLRRDPQGRLAEQARLELTALGPGDLRPPYFLRENDAPPASDVEDRSRDHGPQSAVPESDTSESDGSADDGVEGAADSPSVASPDRSNPEEPGRGARRAWYRHWAVWTSVALVVGGAVVAGVLLSRDRPELGCQTTSCAIIE
ncbi:MAG: tetratricopeptide repeat protein [Myxococcota bacterium]